MHPIYCDMSSECNIWLSECDIWYCQLTSDISKKGSTTKDDPRMSEILEAAGRSPCYEEAVQAKLDGLTAEEVKKLPHHHGAKEFH